MKSTIIIPTYNESENLPVIIRQIMKKTLVYKVFIVDDNSPDGTGEIADDLAQEYPGKIIVIHRSEKQGLRTAYLEGIKSALLEDGDSIVQMDADLSHDPGCLEAMAAALEINDVVLGSRYTPGGEVDRSWPGWRKGLSAWANFYARNILNLPIRDVTTGYRMWKTEVLRKMPLDRIKSNGYVFLVEMVFLAHLLGYRIFEVPIYFSDRRSGNSKMSIKIQLEAAFRIWQLLVTYRDIKR